MKLVLIGVNHKTAPLALREMLNRSCGEASRPILQRILATPGVREAYFLATCNRFEILVSTDHPELALEGLKRIMTPDSVCCDEIERCLYVHRNEQAVRHLFRVASSLDSMVMGEPQILGQVKDAYREATEAKAAGIMLNKLLHQAFRTAKRVRTETAIAENAVSVSFAAIELAKQIFGHLSGKTILLVGAGEMTELAARHLVNQQIGRILVANRTTDRAARLAEEVHGEPMALDQIDEALGVADIVISSTGSPSYLITKEMIQAALHRRRNRLMLLIDVAVPRDIDPTVAEVDNVYLYNIDDLQQVVDENLRSRLGEAQKGEAIVAEEVLSFRDWYNTLEIVPTIVSLRKKIEGIVAGEIEKSQGWIRDLSPEAQENLRILSESILNKVIHDPIACLKTESNGDAATPYVEAVRKLFKLEKDSDK